MKTTESSILNYLDLCEFPILDNGYYYHIDQKMSIFRKGLRWGMAIEILSFNNHQVDVNGIYTLVYFYGNGISNEDTHKNPIFLNRAKDYEVPAIIEIEDKFECFINSKAKYIEVNEKLLLLEHDLNAYEKAGIKLECKDLIRPWEFLRLISPKSTTDFWLSREELSKWIPMDLDLDIEIKNWEHPDGFDKGPSEMSSFKEIANSIANQTQLNIDIIDNERSNTKWRNYPGSGSL